jgi:site-specific DNA-methyltransferase (adenine-specific)
MHISEAEKQATLQKAIDFRLRETFGDCPHYGSIKTPLALCNEVVAHLPDLNGKYVCILFNPEFFYAVAKKYPQANITLVSGSNNAYNLHYNVFRRGIGLLSEIVIVEPHNTKELEEKMNGKKFDCVIGNPPYQLEDGGNAASAKPLYHEFVRLAKKLSTQHIAFVIPSRWMKGGKGLTEFRQEMMEDKSIKLIQHFDDASKIFPGTNIMGGVQYFLMDSRHNGQCDFNGEKRDLNQYDIILTEQKAQSIIDKIVSEHSGFMNETVGASKPYGLRAHNTNFCDENEDGAIKCYTKGRIAKWTKDKYTDRDGTKDKWKVMAPRADGSMLKKKRVKTFLAEPNSICVETYLIVNHFDNEQEAKNFIEYTKTKFFRFLLNLRMVSQDMTRDRFAWVPDMKDCGKVWTDQELYEHFGLTQEEIDYIESVVK